MSEGKKTAREIIEGYDGPAVRIMEVCGTHTHEIFRLGIRKLLPKQVELISGPGCPVCVTPVSYIDEAVYLALEKSVTICTFGDLVRVPGSKKSLADARSEGGKIHIVYSPADAEKYAKEHPEEEVVFLSVGFETTTPAGCLSVKKAKEEGYFIKCVFVLTVDPQINIARIESRVASGGHDVDSRKVVERYYKSINNIKIANQCQSVL